MLLTGCVCLLAPRASAQEPDQEPQDTTPTLQELLEKIERLEQEHQDELEDLYFDLEGLEQQMAGLEAAGRDTPQRTNVFNPSITVFGNFLARTDNQAVYLDNDPSETRIDDQFNLREVEVDFRAAIDPWADGVVITSYESEVSGDTGVDIEEGYVVLKKLPYFDTAPAGLKLKVGRFRTAFGRFNLIHLHDLPQAFYPNSLNTFLGEEGYIRDGVSGQFFLPAPSDSQAIEATVEVLNGGALPLAEDQSNSQIAGLGHLKWFFDLGRGSNIELGASGWQSDSDHRLYGADATYKWRPAGAGEWRSFLLGGELYQADVRESGLSNNSTGFFVWSQYQFNRNVYFGGRYDRTESLDDASQVTNTYGTYLTYYTTEFLRLRFGLQRIQSDIDFLDGTNTALIELNFVFGSHPVEPYWVNR